jgi:hypothetical protein
METEILKKIAHQLQQLTEALAPAPQSLGFGPAPKSTQYVFCNRTRGGIWYTLNEQGEPDIIEHQALTGYIRKLEFPSVQRRGQDARKLHCTIEGDRPYVLESSHDSHFSKGLLNAIAALSPEQLKQPVTIVPQASTQNAEVLFCNVWQGNQPIFATYDEATDWRLVSRAAIDLVRAANGELELKPTLAQDG